MPPLYPETDSADVPVELAPGTWLVVPPKHTELPAGSGPGVFVVASSAQRAETIVKAAITSKGAITPTKALPSSGKTIVAKAANNTIWLGKRAETLRGANRPPVAGEPFALLPDVVKRKRILDAAGTGRLKPELKREALHFWHLEDLGGSRGRLSLRQYLDAISNDLSTVTHTVRHDTARIGRTVERSIKRDRAVRLIARYGKTLVREIEAHPERAAAALAVFSGPANVLVILEGKTIERKSVAIGHSAVRYGKTLAREIEAHPERAAAVLATAAVVSVFVGPEGGALVLETLATAGSIAAGGKALSRGEYTEAGFDFLSAGLGAGGLTTRLVLRRLPEVAARREATKLESVVQEEVEPTPASYSLSAAEKRTVDQATAERRRLVRRAEAYTHAATKTDVGAATFAWIAVDPHTGLRVIDLGVVANAR